MHKMALGYTSCVLFLLFFDIICCQNSSQYDLPLETIDRQEYSHEPNGRQSYEENPRILKPKPSSRNKLLQLANSRLAPMLNDPQNYEANYGQTSIQERNRQLSKIRQLNQLNLEPHLRANFKLEIPDLKCDFETACAWEYNTSVVPRFKVTTSEELNLINKTTANGKLSFPLADGSNNKDGHYLYLALSPKMKDERWLRSPIFRASRLESCTLELLTHQNNMNQSIIKIIVEKTDHKLMIQEMVGNNNNGWNRHRVKLGIINDQFRIVLEVVPSENQSQVAHIAVDNLNLVHCFQQGAFLSTCTATEIKCTVDKIPFCINISKICDITVDCDRGEDEMQDCDKIPPGGRCDFETGWCGWSNAEHGRAVMKWFRHQGVTPTDNTGPDADHTHSNVTGTYIYVNMNQTGGNAQFANNAALDSTIFNPPPRVHGNPNSNYYNSCMVRFYHHQFSQSSSTVVGSINLFLVEIKPKENITTSIWYNSKNRGEKWNRAEIILPNVTTRYFLQFEGRMGMRIYTDVAIDDFSMSPECFGLNIPTEELDGYNYWDPQFISPSVHPDFANKKIYELTTCHAEGRNGPTQENCDSAYNDSIYEISVMGKDPHRGMQVWTVPNEGYYTVIAKGAGGGRGSDGVGSTRGATARVVLELHKGEQIYILVGQQGLSACYKSVSGKVNSSCEVNTSHTGLYPYRSKTHEIMNTIIHDGGGGGGGGSFVFLMNSEGKHIPLAIGAGGGGLGVGRFVDEGNQHGHTMNHSKEPHSGYMYGKPTETAGSGGGWDPYEGPITPGFSLVMGQALVHGGQGGAPCNPSRGRHGEGGFGGGGGGCTKGGGGGGYSGGDTSSNSKNGDGGYSFVGVGRELEELSNITAGSNSGAGHVIIIPAIKGCGCDYQCVSLDEFRSEVKCICPAGWVIRGDDATMCESFPGGEDAVVPLLYWVAFFVIAIVLLVSVLALIICKIYNRFLRKKQAALRHKMILEQDLTLNRLRSTTDESALTNFNPNYGCDGLLNGNIDVKTLPQVARDSLRLVKALGQGAFGEVYQGLYQHRLGDAVEMPVAVKTLPDMSTGQAESDFLMEAAIMAKFNHPNIVHLIGVCFDRLPRFIVLELLAGGDLKNFLREGRPKAERPSVLTTKDLMFCALDIAKGCRYMETKRFIHRDIAARNCLLTSKGPGRVVKIADFGMARDIYRSDYYRKGGKALLPIKWMPPEAFLDAIFTTKSDVWSFGVVLWEIFSLGIMPYTGCTNTDVMQLVASGGRLDTPPGCPVAAYRIMCDCWNPTPDHRPSFSQLYERLTICTQDPEIMNAPLPSFSRLPSAERDVTIMRPPGDEDCLQIPNSSDYLIPLPGPSPPQSTSTDRLLDNSDIQVTEGNWETSFISNGDPKSSGENNGVVHGNGASGPTVDKLISIDTPQQTPTNTQAPVNIGQCQNKDLRQSSIEHPGIGTSDDANRKLSKSCQNVGNYQIHTNPINNISNLNKTEKNISSLTNISLNKQPPKNVTENQNHSQSIPLQTLNSSHPNNSNLTLSVTELERQNANLYNKKSYMNISNIDSERKANGPFSIQNQSLKNTGYLNNDSEISC